MLGGWWGGGPALSVPINPSGAPAGIIAGQDYEVSAWLRTDRQGLHKVSVAVDDAKAWQPNAYAKSAAVVGPAWTQVRFRFRAPSSDTTANLSIYLRQEGRLWVDDAEVRLLTAADRAVAPSGNLVRNSSFEVGALGWLNRYTSSSIVADATAPHGGNVLSLSWFGGSSNRYLSHAFPLPWGHQYTVSLWLRAVGLTAGQTVTVPVSVGGPDTKITTPSTALATASFAVTGDWARYSFSFTAPPVPGEAAFLIIDPPDGPALRMDAVQVEAGGSAGAYAPRNVVEGALDLNRQTGWVGAYSQSESVSATARLYNSGPTEQSVTLRRRSRDVWDAVVPGSSASEVVVVPANSAVTRQYTFATAGRTGAFRAEIDVDDAQTAPAADATFAVLPAAPAAGVNAPIGTHMDMDYQTTNPRSAGAGWTKTWRTTWADLETTNDVWTYSTANSYLNRWRDAGLKTLAVVGYPPVFAQNRPATGAITFAGSWYPPLSSSDATDYAQRLVDNLGDRVHAWELGNEPDQFLFTVSGTTRSQAYPAEALAYATGIRSRSPSAPILLGSATTDRSPEEWISNALVNSPANADGKTLRDLVTGVSFHNYDPDPATTRRIAQRLRTRLAELAATYQQPALANLELWDTEWAPMSSPAPFSRHRPRLNANTLTAPDARRSAALVVRGYVARLGEGVVNSFLYHAYGGGGVNEGDYDLGYEIDGTPRPLVPAYAIAAQWLKDAVQPVALTAPGVWGYRFLRSDGRPLYVLWADETQTSATVPYTAPAAVTAYDMMGNAYGTGTYAAGATVPVPPEPIYLLGPATSLQTSYGSIIIESGDTTPSAAEGTDFGAAEVNYGPAAVSHVFNLRNLGLGDLTLTGSPRVQLSGANAADFVVESAPAATIPSGGVVTFALRFQPAATGLRSAVVTIPTSSGSFTMTVSGTGTTAVPAAGLSAGNLALDVPLGSTVDISSLVLQNLGRGVLNWTASLPTTYVADNSTQSGGPAYDWYDLRTLGTPATFVTSGNVVVPNTQNRDDFMSTAIPIGFSFPFYGSNYTNLRVSPNGVITFEAAGEVGWTSDTLPSSAALNKSIMVLWDDLYLIGGVGQVYTYQPDASTFVVSWVDVGYFASSQRNIRQNFQIVLKRDGTIICQYANVANSPNTGGFTIGLQNANSAAQALLYSRSTTAPSSNLAIRFRPPPPGWAALTVAGSGSVSGGSSQVLGLRFSTAGLTQGLTYSTTLTLTTNDGALATVQVPINVRVTAPADAVAPTVALTSPSSGASLTNTSPINLTATAAVTGSVIDRVDFYRGNQLIGTDTNAPYSLDWVWAPSGPQILSAVARAANTLSTTSAPVAVNVLRPDVPSTGLLAHWRFDEGTGLSSEDLSGNQRAASWSGGAATWQTGGRFSSCLGFDGTTASGASFSSPDSAAITVSAWVFLTGEGGTSASRYPRVLALPGVHLLLRRAAGDGTYGSIGLNTIRSGTTGDWRSDVGVMQLNAWYHVAVAYDASSTTNAPVFYLNGARLGTTLITTPTGSPVSNLGSGMIGNRGDNQRPLDGRVDHVRIYNRMLSDVEIAALQVDEGGPGAPQGVSAVAGAEGITLNWQSPGGSGLTYSLERATAAGGLYSNLVSGLGATSHLDQTVAAGMTYFYRVGAVGSGVAGPRSAPVSAAALTLREAWRAWHFGSAAPTASSADSADPDGDGLSNLLEYALGQSPLIAASGPRPVALGLSANRLQLRFQRIADPTIRYEVDAFSDLNAPQLIWSSEGSANTSGEVTVQDVADPGPGNPQRFMRLKVIAP